MTNKEKIDLAFQLIEEVIEDSQTDAFRFKSERNEKISGVIHTFGSEFLLKLRPLKTWIHESDD